MTRSLAFAALVGTLFVAGCQGFGQAITAHTDVVARVPGHAFSVDDAAAILAQNPDLPAQPEVVEALANLWVDYVLLAKVASGNGIEQLDTGVLMRPYIEQEMIRKLADQVLERDDTLSDEDLRREFEDEQPGLEVRARHILLRVPADATAAERDSVLALARELRDRAREGEDFAELAREHSQDPGSREEGGDLGFFGSDEMVPPFEEAAFALEVGEVSDVVETPFGFHVIAVEERRLPDFEEIKEQYRQYRLSERQRSSEEAYIQGVTEPLSLRVQDGAFDVARELARKSDMQLRGRAGSRPLVSYRGGAYTAREFQQEMRRLPQPMRMRYASVADEQLENVLRRLTERKLLVAEAERLGLGLTDEERAQLKDEASEQITELARMGGLHQIEPQNGETMTQAIDRKVIALLESVVRPENPSGPLPIDPLLASALREQQNVQIHERAFQQVVSRFQSAVEQGRNGGEPAQAPAEQPSQR